MLSVPSSPFAYFNVNTDILRLRSVSRAARFIDGRMNVLSVFSWQQSADLANVRDYFSCLRGSVCVTVS